MSEEAPPAPEKKYVRRVDGHVVELSPGMVEKDGYTAASATDTHPDTHAQSPVQPAAPAKSE